MTTQEWIAQATQDREPIVELLRTYHPLNRPASRGYTDHRITANGAERACESIRAAVAAGGGEDPIASFDAALSTADVSKLMTVLNEAWFGVPESSDCWRITGFKEAVRLLEDPPDDVDDSEEQTHE